MGSSGRVINGSTVQVDGLRIEYGSTLLEPRPWTALQGRWAAELAVDLPPGPILEVCSGAGHIGLVAAAGCDRPLVQVDANPSACDYARRNAEAAGLADRVTVRCGSIDDVRTVGERFPLVIADPPYVPSEAVVRFPGDPRHTIDGGPDGLGLARACVDLFVDVLVPGGVGLLQLGSLDQVEQMAAYRPDAVVHVDRRDAGPTRHLMLFERLTKHPSGRTIPTPAGVTA
jgi:release factor glutamine methyltransferase